MTPPRQVVWERCEKFEDTPIPSMYGILTYIWLICMVNVGKYTIHGCYGICIPGTCEFVLYFKGCVFHPPHESPNSLHSKQRVESCGNVGSRFLHSTSPGLAGRSSKPAVEINHSRVCYQKKYWQTYLMNLDV